MEGGIYTLLELALIKLVENEEIFSMEIIMNRLHKNKRRANNFGSKLNELMCNWNDVILNIGLARNISQPT